MEYKIYHIPNPPDKGFQFSVQSIDQAKAALNVLAYLDLDFSNIRDNNRGEVCW